MDWNFINILNQRKNILYDVFFENYNRVYKYILLRAALIMPCFEKNIHRYIDTIIIMYPLG